VREIPALYDIARQITNDAGFDYYDPRTGKKSPAPKRPDPQHQIPADPEDQGTL
jgi:hypothetical protein